ncbi:hypothetical protein [Nocardia sp. NPDC050710]|uniref:hypothetical protein n=1 Tax=Nocardia sp. NPDC050710 TaxID=3157220 RepID=UPI0033ECA4F9
MESERDSPHWKAIVGDNWPAIGPADWSALETLARAGAAVLDPDSVERQRREFDERVRASKGLDPVKDSMRSQRGTSQGLADALVASADTFRDFSDLVYRTRNRILDVVDRATRQIRDAPDPDTSGDGTVDEAEATAARARTTNIIAAARAEVADVAAEALRGISPSGLPSLAAIAEALGRPGPWGPGSRGGPPVPRKRTQTPGGKHTDRPTDRGADHKSPPSARPNPAPVPPPSIDRPVSDRVPPDEDPDVVVIDPDMPHPPADGGRPRADQPIVDGGPTQPRPQTPFPAHPSGTTPIYAPNPGSGGPGTVYTPSIHPSGAPDAESGAPPAGGATTRSGSGATGSDPIRDATERAPAADAPLGARRSDPNQLAASAERGTSSVGAFDPAPDEIGGAQTPLAPAMPPPIMPPAPPVAAPPTVTAAPSVTAAATGSSAGGTTSASSAAGASPQARSAPVAAESKAAVAGQVSANPGSVSAPGNATSPAAKDPSRGRSGGHEDGGADTVGSDALVHGVVGAAMAAAAAPAFVMGERVDGDLVLARTLLSGALAVADSSTVGLALAVSIMRHAGGVNAFVTSNEGRGWLPAGLYLPREVSTPWVWQVSNGTAWEGISDPARVLVEFGAAWGAQSGARLAAVVSALPIDAGMRAQLRDVPMQGEVAAASDMPLGSPAPGLADRLEMVAAPRLLDRIARVAGADIGARRVDLARDADARVRRLGSAAPSSLELPALRQRILQAVVRGREVREQWWEDLRDADDLLVASMLSLRADVARIPLGQLRSEQPSDQSASAATLRGMVFERRCDELVLLLEQPPTRQSLRDAVYAHGQITDHPLFAQTPPGASGAAAAPRSSISAGPPR